MLQFPCMIEKNGSRVNRNHADHSAYLSVSYDVSCTTRYGNQQSVSCIIGTAWSGLNRREHHSTPAQSNWLEDE